MLCPADQYGPVGEWDKHFRCAYIRCCDLEYTVVLSSNRTRILNFVTKKTLICRGSQLTVHTILFLVTCKKPNETFLTKK